MRIITVANQKGGTGKTTTAHAIITGAAARGLRALGVDFDPQCNLSFMMAAKGGRPGAYDLTQGKAPRLVIQQTAHGDIIPGQMEVALIDKGGQLAHALRPVTGAYDVTVIDSAPTLGAALGNALEAATDILIPLQADPLSLRGLVQIVEAARHYNPRAVMLGVFLMKYSPRSIINRNMADAIRDRCHELDIPFIDAPIREGVSVREAQLLQTSLFEYAPRSKPAADFMALLDAIQINAKGD